MTLSYQLLIYLRLVDMLEIACLLVPSASLVKIPVCMHSVECLVAFVADVWVLLIMLFVN
jgi:hypothetical protein